ncbi:putative mitochondrial protein [Tanacetum coccineum]
MPNTPPINVRPYRHPPNQKDAIEGMVKELMDSGVIRASQSPFSSPIVMVKKKDGTWRMCIDYRQLNKHKVKDKFPIPVIEELIDELNGFLGLTGYYRRFIKDYASISQPLVALTKKDAFKWNPSAELAYHKLKEAMVQAPVLALPNFDQEFMVETDASGKGIRAVLFWVRQHLDKWKGYLLDRHFKIRTYHFSLKYLLNQKLTTPFQFKWLPKLLGYATYWMCTRGKWNCGKLMLCQEWTQHFHDEAIGGHSSALVTMKKLGSLFYWKGLKKMVKQMVKDCDVCQRQKPDLSAYLGLIQPLPIIKSWKEFPGIS